MKFILRSIFVVLLIAVTCIAVGCSFVGELESSESSIETKIDESENNDEQSDMIITDTEQVEDNNSESEPSESDNVTEIKVTEINESKNGNEQSETSITDIEKIEHNNSEPELLESDNEIEIKETENDEYYFQNEVVLIAKSDEPKVSISHLYSDDGKKNVQLVKFTTVNLILQFYYKMYLNDNTDNYIGNMYYESNSGSVIWIDNDRLLLSGLYIYDINTDAKTKVYDTNNCIIHGTTINRTKTHIAYLIYKDGKHIIELMEISTGNIKVLYEGSLYGNYPGAKYSIYFSDNEHLIFNTNTNDEKEEIFKLSIIDGKTELIMTDYMIEGFSQDGKYVIATNFNNNIIVDLSEFKKLLTFPSHIYSFNSHGFIYVHQYDNGIYYYDFAKDTTIKLANLEDLNIDPQKLIVIETVFDEFVLTVKDVIVNDIMDDAPDEVVKGYQYNFYIKPNL